MPAERPSAAEVAHVSLRLGRLMLVHGADTALVEESVEALAARLGYCAQLIVSAEGLVLTLEDQANFRTKVGHAVSAMSVDMGALAALDQIARQAPAGPSPAGPTPAAPSPAAASPAAPGLAAPSIATPDIAAPDIAQIDRQLAAVERGGNRYPVWLVALGLGLTAASLARLFGGDWPVVAASGLVGIVSLFLRRRLGAWSVNPIAAAALVALGSGLVGALAMKAFPGASPTLALVAAGMILVPGVPLLNGVHETLGNHVGTGLSRLTVGAITILAIAAGLFVAAGLAGDTLPVEGTATLMPVGEDLVFSALAGIGYALLFNVPSSAAWGCMLCAAAGHGLRTALEHLGLGLVAGSLIAAFAAGVLARLLARSFKVPAVIFAFPGVVAMIPGAYAFRAGIGGLDIMQAGAAAPPALVADTIALAITATLVTAAIAIGLSVALAAPFATTTHQAIGMKGDRR
jgi:uncharacterized membrane protein YjjP (DUF1212 family)